MSDYTPTEWEVRECYVRGDLSSYSNELLEDEFERWLKQHDHKVAERARLDHIEMLKRFLQSEVVRLEEHGGSSDPMLDNYLGGINTAITELSKEVDSL